MSESDLYETGIEARRAFLGAEYVASGLAESDDFMMSFQRAVTEVAWGFAWGRGALETRERAILTLGILAGSGRFDEFAIYTKGAARNGVTVDEIKDILQHIVAYCGTPSGHQAFLAAHSALKEVGAID